MKSFADRYREDRRQCILHLLSQQGGWCGNNVNIHAWLLAMAVKASRDDVNTDLAWLADQSLVTLEPYTESVTVAKLTPRGLDVAEGNASVPGVSRPALH